MNHIFGGVLVCSDLDTANTVAFNPQIRSLCVTLEGDKVNPSGELSGGAPSKTGCMLTQIQAVIEASNSLESKMEQLSFSEKKLRELEKLAQHYNNLKHQYDLKKHELELIHERLKTTRHHQLAQEVQEMEQQNVQLQTDLKEAKLLQDQGANR